MEIVVVQEICSGMQRFCLSEPPGIDYAWDATSLFISLLGQVQVEPGQFDVQAFVVADFKYWIAENSLPPTIVTWTMSPVALCETTTVLSYP